MTGMAREPGQAAVVRILKPEGEPEGTGVLIGQRHVVTAAHNVTAVLGTSGPVGRTILLDFPLLAPGQAVRARVERYVERLPHQASDLCGLVLLDDPPAGVLAAPTLRDPVAAGTRFQLFGVPAGRSAGFWLETVFRGYTAGRLMQVQVSADSPIGVLRGYSGGPLWATEQRGLCGIILTSEEKLRWTTAYALPVEEIFRLWPELEQASRRPSPYRGLSAFEEADRHQFFGRSGEARRLAEKIRSQPTTLVIASPGLGKSSLVRAGVVPLLREHGHRIAYLDTGIAGQSVAQRLADALAPLIYGVGEDLVEDVAGAAQLAGIIGRDGLGHLIRPLTREGPLAIVIDQLEELLAQEPQAVGHLFNLLLPHSGTQLSGSYALRLVACLRAEFRDAAIMHLPVEALETPFELMPMTADGLAEAIARPAELAGHVRFSPETVQRIVDDARAASITGAPGELLPLVQFTASELWSRAQKPTIGLDDYHRLGGVSSALVRVADDAVDRLGPEASKIARGLLTRLVHVGRHPSQDTRETVLAEELPDGQWTVVQQLASARLVTVIDRPDGKHSVRLVHDALLTRWQRLRDWIAQDRAFRLFHAELHAAHRRWLESSDQNDLLRGKLLDEALRWSKLRGADLRKPERTFIEDSRVESARERRRRRLLPISLVGVLAVTLVAALGFWVVVPLARTSAADSLLAKARQLEDDDVSRLAVHAAAQRMESRPDTVRPVLDDLLDNRGTVALLPVAEEVRDLAVVGDGSRVLIRQNSGRLVVWDVGPDGPRRTATEAGISALAASDDGEWVATGDQSGQITVRDARSWAVLHQYTGPESTDSESDEVERLSFDALGHRLAAVAGLSRRVRLIDLASGAVRDRVVDDGQYHVTDVGFAGGGVVVMDYGLSDSPLAWNPAKDSLQRLPAGPPSDSDDTEMTLYGPRSLIVHCQDGGGTLLDAYTRKLVRPAPVSSTVCPIPVVTTAGGRVVYFGDEFRYAVGGSLMRVQRLLAFDGDLLLAAIPVRPGTPEQPSIVGVRAALSATGRFVATVEAGAVRVVRLPKQPLKTTAEVCYATFLPDNSLLVLRKDGIFQRFDAEGVPVVARQTSLRDPAGASVAADGSRLTVVGRAGSGDGYRLARFTLPDLEELGKTVRVPVGGNYLAVGITTLSDGRTVLRLEDGLLVYARQPDTAEPRRLGLRASGQQYVPVISARPGTSEVAVVAPTGSGFQMVDIDHARTGPTWGPLAGDRTGAIFFDAKGDAVVVGGNSAVVVDPDTGSARDDDSTDVLADLLVAGANATQVMSGWPRLLAEWGFPPNTTHLWPAETGNSTRENPSVLLSNDGRSLAVFRGDMVDVLPTDPGGWRTTICDIVAEGMDEARSHLRPTLVLDPC